MLGLAPTPAGAATVTFGSTGGEQTFTVPAGVTKLYVVAVGGSGGQTTYGGKGGVAASVNGELNAAAGEIIYVEVGGAGGNGSSGSAGSGGFNGGANGGAGLDAGAGGGGASDVRTVTRADGAASLTSRMLVAGGGGGGGGDGASSNGGAAEHPGTTYPYGGGGGTQLTGGSGGTGNGANGHSGALGAGGEGGEYSLGIGQGGGGAGGYYGGGGGGAGEGGAPEPGWGGGGGSSLVPPGGSSLLAAPAAASEVRISWTPPAQSSGAMGSTPSAAHGTEGSAGVPRVTGLRETHTAWREGHAAPRISARVHKRTPVGTEFSFSLNEAATVTLTFSRHAVGHRSGHRCVIASRSRGRRCTATTIVGRLTFAAHAGANNVVFQGVLPYARLRHGRYTLTLTASASTGASTPQALSFTIVK